MEYLKAPVVYVDHVEYAFWVNFKKKVFDYVCSVLPLPTPPPTLEERVGNKEMSHIVHTMYDEVITRYVAKVHEHCKTIKFNWQPKYYGIFLSKADPTSNLELFEDTEAKRLEEVCFEMYSKDIILEFRENPEKLFNDPETIKNYLTLVKENKNSPDGWDSELYLEIQKKIIERMHFEWSRGTMSHSVAYHMNKLEMKLKLEQLEMLRNAKPMEIDNSASDMLNLSFAQLDFNKYKYDLYAIKNLTIYDIKPVEFMIKIIGNIFDFGINNIPLVIGLGVFSIIIWIGLIIFIDFHYKIDPKFKEKWREARRE